MDSFLSKKVVGFLNFLVFVLKFLKNYLKSVRLAFSLNGPKALPVIGNALMIKDSDCLEEVGNNVYNLYGWVMRTWVSVMPLLWIYEPKHIKLILSSSKNSEKNVFYKAMHNFLGQGLITNNGLKWKQHRKLIQPYFSLNVLETYIKSFTESAKNLAETLEVNENLNITCFINNCVLEILHNSILGIPLDLNSPYRKGDTQLVHRITRPWLLLDSFFSFTKTAEKEEEQKLSLRAYTKKIVLERQTSHQESTEGCLLDYFIEISRQNSEFSLDDVINETITFMLAGQDSVGSTLGFAFYYIARYENVQNRIVEEIQTIPDEETLTISKLNNLKFLEQVIKETLRLAPSVPILARVLTEDVTINGIVFPEGLNICISPFITHRLSHVYKDPLKFDPERFSDENVEKLDPYAFIPFSMGPRNCMGYKFAILEIKTVLFYILKKYKLSLAETYDRLRLTFRTTLRAKGGIRLNVQLRK